MNPVNTGKALNKDNSIYSGQFIPCMTQISDYYTFLMNFLLKN